MEQQKLVSIVIPCYNHGSHLPESIQSVQAQTYKNIEIIVVDDGSTDNTAEMAKSFAGVRYIYQQNKGLSAARNTGIAHSKGDYLLFLDADDWLLPNGVETNVGFLQQDPKIGFVSGNYISFYVSTQTQKLMKRHVSQDPYAELLLYNNVNMHASVLFPRWVFDLFLYDESLKASEDWDLYLRITRQFPIVQHDMPIAVYIRYDTSMSRNNIVMLETGLKVLEKQKAVLRTDLERKNIVKGRKILKEKFTSRIYNKLVSGHTGNTHEKLYLFRHDKVLYLKFLLKTFFHSIRPKTGQVLAQSK